MNAGKTKQLILNETGVPTPLILTDQSVEMVQCFKYLGSSIDDKLNLTENPDAICKKANDGSHMMVSERIIYYILDLPVSYY